MGSVARPGWRVSSKGRLLLGFHGFTTTCKLLTMGPPIKVRGYGVRYKVPGAQISVKEKFFLRGKAFYKVKSYG
jgi:hypothetical protein